MKIISTLFFIISLSFAQPYPHVFSQMGTPLFKASEVFDKYNDVERIQKLSTDYTDTVKSVLEYGYRLDKQDKAPKKEVLTYLKELRKLQKQHDAIINTFSFLLLQSIEDNNYGEFERIASIELQAIVMCKDRDKTIAYYQNKKKKVKIKNIEQLIENNKIKSRAKIKEQFNTRPFYDVYWVSSIGGNKGYESGVFGANRDDLKHPVKMISLTSRLSPCTVDKGGNIYWCDVGNQAIYKADPDGTNIRAIITGLYHPRGIAIDNKRGRVYYSDWLKSEKKGIVSYASLSGANPKIFLQDGLRSGGHLFVDAIYDKLYIADSSGEKIIQVDIKTKNTKEIVFARQIQDLVIDYKNNRIIWADTIKDNIASVNFDGTDSRVLIKFLSKFSNPKALSIDTVNSRLIYAFRSVSTHKTRIETADLDGSNRTLVNRSVNSVVESLFCP